jgi:hypothetical protein
MVIPFHSQDNSLHLQVDPVVKHHHHHLGLAPFFSMANLLGAWLTFLFSCCSTTIHLIQFASSQSSSAERALDSIAAGRLFALFLHSIRIVVGCCCSR